MLDAAVDMATCWSEAEVPRLRLGRPPQRPRVVVAHAHGWIRRAVARSLERAGYAVTIARQGAELLDRLEEDGIAAVVVALELPDLHGLELLAAMRCLAHHVPVVVLGESAEPAVREASERLGALLPSAPFDLDAVTDAVGIVCRRTR
jgi:DNA-binding response OmpR family regulator